MNKREESMRCFETGECYLMEISDKCIICNKGNYGDIMIIKIPEGVLECLDCAKQYHDYKVYKGIEGGWDVYKIGTGII